MPDKALSDKDLLAAAIRKFRTQNALAAHLDRSKGAVSQWKKLVDGGGQLPDMVRRVLLSEVEGMREKPWADPSWQAKMRASKTIEQVMGIFYRTKTLSKEWHQLEAFLDNLQPWGEEEWRRLHESGVDWVFTNKRKAKQA